MTVPEPESLPDAERAGAVSVGVPQKTDRGNDSRLPWQGKTRAADIFCWLGIVLSGLFYWLLLPLRLSLLGTHPVVAELLNGSIEAIVAAAAFARAGHGTLAVVLLAAIPGLMKFDVLYWWAGRLWGERFIMTLPGGRSFARHMARMQRAGRRFTWPAVVVSYFLPIPSVIVFVIAGWARMRLTTFLILNLAGVLLWAGLLAGLGYELGQHAVAAAKTISHYSWWFTIGIVALTLIFAFRSHRRLIAAAPVTAADQDVS